jgi:hypothetical protein
MSFARVSERKRETVERDSVRVCELRETER